MKNGMYIRRIFYGIMRRMFSFILPFASRGIFKNEKTLFQAALISLFRKFWAIPLEVESSI
jgi:hypothetical protein